MSLLLFIASALLYGGASFAYGAEEPLWGRDLRPWGRVLLFGAAAVHLAVIGAQCLHGNHPLQSVFLVSSLGAWVAVVGYLLISRRRRLDPLGALLAPVGLAGLVLGVLFDGEGVDRIEGTAVLARAHVSLATAGVAGFILAAGVAGLYVAMERKLRSKAFRPDQANDGMSLTGLDRLHHLLMLLVTPVFTLAIVTGVLWILRAGGPEILAGRVFELVVAGVAWLASIAVVVSRAMWGTRGRPAAGLTLLAFACVVAVLIYYGVRA